MTARRVRSRALIALDMRFGLRSSNLESVSRKMQAILNRPPEIAEDAVCYRLHLPLDQSSKPEIESLVTTIQAYVEGLLPNHLWNRDSFELKPIRDSKPEVWLLQGLMRIGDCVDDEWLVVWLLKQITSRWPIVASCVWFFK
jgi:hypothetical protein